MKRVFENRVLIWLLAAILLAGLGFLIWILISALYESPAMVAPDYWPTNGWKTSSPEEQGLDSVKLAEGLQSMKEKQISIDSLLIIRNGYVVLDAHFYPYDGSFPHDLASVTKSFMTTLIGIAADQDKLHLDQQMVSFFEDRTIANLDTRKEHLTIKHLAGMVNGFSSGCIAGDETTLNSMRSNPDWIQAALDRKMTSEPGTSFCYDSPGMHLLSAILQEATGMTALEFAQVNLFDPLGIKEVVWDTDPQGYTRGWGDLHLLPRDAAKLGYLWLNQGIWDGKQVVSSSWVEESSTAQTKATDDDYGYGWWISPDSFYAMGRGGQNIIVLPSLNLLLVTTGAGFDFDQIVPYLEDALVDSDKPLPDNPDGQAALSEVLNTLQQDASPKILVSYPETIQKISNRTFTCESNAAGLASIRLEFDAPELATLFMKLNGVDVTWPIGLDGGFRLSSDGLGNRGYWEDSRTFILEMFDIGVRTCKLDFEEDHLDITLPEVGSIFTCQAQNN